MAEIEIATYEEVKDLVNHPEVVLIDVREASEIKETGQIPTSINIPLGLVIDDLKLSDEAFQAKYNHEKPKSDTPLIFHCKMGGRAGKAAENAVEMGFVNVKNYKGSWSEWAAKEGL